MRILAAALALPLALSAQPPRRAVPPSGTSSPAAPADAPPPPPVRPEDKCSIEGTVVNALTGEPLKKAHLTLRPMGVADGGVPYGTITNAGGQFLIDDVDPGRYFLSAIRNGFVNQTYSPQGATNRNTPLTLGNGQHLKEIVFKMTPQGVITGRVVDEDGDPLPNVMLQCLTFVYQRGSRQFMPSGAGQTNDLGEYRIHGLRPGKYYLSATYRSPDMFMSMPERTVGSAAAVQAAQEGYATTYYPNAPTPEAGTQIQITPGVQIRGIDMTLIRTRTVRIKGRVTAAAGAPARRNTNIMLLPRESSFIFMPRAIARILDRQGNFELRGVAPGSYVLRADFVDDQTRYTARVPIEVGTTNIDGLEVNLQPPVEVSGSVKIEENGDLKGANLNISLQPHVAGPMMGGAGARINDDLTFKLTNITPDPYDVNVFGLPEGFYVKSVRMGDLDVTETGLDFSQGVPAGEMTITLNPNGGQVEGTVQNAKGENAAGALVTLIPDDSHRSMTWLFRTANTDQNGHFIMKGLRPGQYKIYAWEDIDPGAYMDPDFVKPHESAGEDVAAKEGGHETVSLKAIPPDANVSR